MGVPRLRTSRLSPTPHTPVHPPQVDATRSLVADASIPFVSVIVPVFNDVGRLQSCLQALDEQSYPKSHYEVIVVDNGSEHSVEPLVRTFGQARAAYEVRPGSYAARNRGIRLAGGEILAFTDADCIPARDWLENGVRRVLTTPDRGLVAGRIEVFIRDPDRPTAAEIYDALTAFPQKTCVEQRRYGMTANAFTSRSVLESVGLFEPTLKSGGDVEWGQRATALGYRLVYADDARVRHPARRSLRALCGRQRRLVGGQQDRKRRHGYSTPALVRDIALDLLPSLGWARQLWRSASGCGTMQQAKIVAIMWSLKYVSACERLRLQLGGTSRR